MPVRIVQSKQNARLKELRKALANPPRESARDSAAGAPVLAGPVFAGIEGPNLLEEALRARSRVACVFLAQGFESLLAPLHLPPETEILLLPRELLDSALTTETPQPIAALIETPDWTWAHLLGSHHDRAPLVLVLAGLQDPGNLGTILRSAEAFGATGILTLPGTVSPWNPKAVRASAGSVFRLPVLAASAIHSIDRLREAGLKIFTTTAGTAEPADFVDLTGPVALLIGNEGNGVPKPLSAMADSALTIPCPGPVESLNAAVAASVLLYEASRQRSLRTGGPTSLRGDRR
ncbi:MAG: RNA methyltransferase [Terracidiphilus sp.]